MRGVWVVALAWLCIGPVPVRAQTVPTCTVTTVPTEHTGPTDVAVTWATTGNPATCVASGRWSGPKDCAGGTVVIRGVAETAEFKLVARSATGKTTARWTKPTQNEDGSPTTISGYRLYVADAPTGLPSATPIPLPATPLEYTFWRPPGPVSAGIVAVRTDDVPSGLSNIVSKTVVAASATCAATVTIKPRPKAPSLTLTWLRDLFTPNRARPET